MREAAQNFNPFDDYIVARRPMELCNEAESTHLAASMLWPAA